MELAAGGDVEVEALLGHQPDHRPAQEGLPGVGDPAGAEGGGVLPAAGPEMGLVVDEQRRAEAFRQPSEVAAADREAPVSRDGRRGREESQVDRGAQGPVTVLASSPGSVGGSGTGSAASAWVRASRVLTRAMRSRGSNGFVT